MPVLYRIIGWNENFEIAQSRRREGKATYSWVATPNKHDGKSFRRLIRRANGVALYGAWQLIVQVASKCPIRGTLSDSDGPLTPADIADKTGAPESIIKSALDVLISQDVKWIEVVSHSEHAPSTLRAHSERATTTEQDSTVQDKTEHTACAESEQPDLAPEDAVYLTYPCQGKVKTWDLTEGKLREWALTWPHFNVEDECRVALQWLKDNPSRQKTANGMPRFIGSWLGRAQNSNRGPVVKAASNYEESRPSQLANETMRRNAEEKLARDAEIAKAREFHKQQTGRDEVEI